MDESLVLLNHAFHKKKNKKKNWVADEMSAELVTWQKWHNFVGTLTSVGVRQAAS